MNDKEIKQIRIDIIQYLNSNDEQQGVNLYKAVKEIEVEDSIYMVKKHIAHNKKEFLTEIDSIRDSINKPTLLTIHIASHGCEDGIGTIYDKDHLVTWHELFAHIRPINIKVCNTLMLVLSVCTGGAIMSHIEPEDRAPFMAFIANTRPIFFKDASVGFPIFYRSYRNPMDFPKALEALNSEINFKEKLPDGRRKTEFFCMSSKHIFDEVFNPDRDKENFKKIVSKLMPHDQKIPQELREQKVRELLVKRANELRPYYNFEDKLVNSDGIKDEL